MIKVAIEESVKDPVATRRIKLELREISLTELLHDATGLTNCRFRIDARAVVLGEAEDLARVVRAVLPARRGRFSIIPGRRVSTRSRFPPRPVRRVSSKRCEL